MISVIVTSRVQGNINSNLPELIRSLAEHSDSPEDIELLVKFDVDDDLARDLHTEINNKELPFPIKIAYGPRGRGYIDIHHGYNQLLPMLYSKTKIVIAMADDFRAEHHWDHQLRQAAKDAGDYFIIHQRPHPVLLEEHIKRDRHFKLGGENIFKDFDMSINPFIHGDNLYIIDEAPAWSPALLKACIIASDPNIFTALESNLIFPLSFTDAWTLCMEYILCHDEHINITKFLDKNYISRQTCEVDQSNNIRWSTDRKINFDYIKSTEFRTVIENQAHLLAQAIRETKVNV